MLIEYQQKLDFVKKLCEREAREIEKNEFLYFLQEINLVHEEDIKYLAKGLNPFVELHSIFWICLYTRKDISFFQPLLPCIMYLNEKAIMVDDVQLFATTAKSKY